MATSLLDMDDRPRPSKLFPLGTLTTTKEYQTKLTWSLALGVTIGGSDGGIRDLFSISSHHGVGRLFCLKKPGL